MGMSTNLLHSDEAVKLEKIGQPARECFVGHGGEKESLILSKKTRSKSRVDCRLFDRAASDYRSEDAFVWP